MNVLLERIELLGPVTWWYFLLILLTSFPLSWIGLFLSLRKQVFMGDAMSHSVLPGIVVGFLFIGNLDSVWLQIGATASAIIAALGVELLQENKRIKQDAAIGITFTTLFSIGVLLISWIDHVDLDPKCIIHGQMEFLVFDLMDDSSLVPSLIIQQAVTTALIMGGIYLIYHALLASSFDLGFSRAMGLKTKAIRYGLLVLLAITLVSSFRLIGAILPIALLVLPNATISMWTERIQWRLWGSLLICILASFISLIVTLGFDLNLAGTLVSTHFLFFLISLVFGANDGLLKNIRFYGKDSSRLIRGSRF